MPNVYSNIGRSLVSFSIIIVFILFVILNDVDSKALRSSNPNQNVNYSAVLQKSFKWISWKFCGKLGDVCKPGSRKHCCAAGFTCVLPLKQQYKNIPHKPRFGRCKPVPTIPMKYREINALVDPTTKRSLKSP